MHAFSHSLAHRAPPATRTRVRWQPYNPLSSQSTSCSTFSTKSPSSSQTSTPSSAISSPPSNTPLPESKLSNQPQNLKEISLPRDSSKKQFAVGLVDQAVKTLGEIWRPQDIPPVFLTSSRAGATLGGPPEPHLSSISCHRMSGSTSISPSSSGCGTDPRGNLVPIKGFVHEVIRRSRTSGCVLQTALCYLEAIRAKVPELVRKEQAGEGVRGESDVSSRIVPATESELKQEEEYLRLETPANLEDTATVSNDFVSTVRIVDIQAKESSSDPNLDSSSSFAQVTPNPQDSPITPITALPSPLLCPRRTFLASLILASKFTQDKCYSNRAWAKLSGLPAREIGRCERALGEALEWRLWVGKTPVQASQPSGPATTSTPNSRAVARSQSENNILTLPSTRSPFLVRQDSRPPPVAPSTHRSLQRCATMPAEAFSATSPVDRVGLSQYRISQELLPTLTSAPVPPIVYADALSQSPSPDNPGLSYSPSSTESSSGDRTIQMSAFIDEPMATYSGPQAATATEFWPCSDNSDPSQDIRISPLALMRNSRVGKAPPVPDNLGVYMAGSGTVASNEHLAPPGYVTHSGLPWLAESEILRPLPFNDCPRGFGQV